MFVHVYNIAMTVGLAFSTPWVVPYTLLTPKRRRTLAARLGLRLPHNLHRPETGYRPFWVHALSVGEALSAVPLVEAIRSRHPDRRLFFSVSTETGLEAAAKALGPLGATLFQSPFDFPPLALKRIFSALNPEAVVIVESDLWPNFLDVAARRRIPVILANARVSDRSFARYRQVRPLAVRLYSLLSAIGTQSGLDLDRLNQLGISGPVMQVTGNIKFDQPVTPMSEPDINLLRQRFGIEPGMQTIVAGSTHPGEENCIAEAVLELRRNGIMPKLISVPRDPGRAEAVCREFNRSGFKAGRWSHIEHGLEAAMDLEVVVVDRIGLLREIYAIGDLAVVGGSFFASPHLGGHNPLEPAAYGKPVIVGPNMRNFKSITAQLLTAHGLVQVENPGNLCNAIHRLLTVRSHALDTGRAALSVFKANSGAANRTLELLDRCLKPKGSSRANTGVRTEP
ncbi:MAG: 3-deoxy-D-manno-octulosonic acid transferase [Desulfobacterales bacterium]